jgi:uncharacterized protein
MRKKSSSKAQPAAAQRKGISASVINRAMIEESRPKFPIKPPVLMPGVVPKGEKAPVIAEDSINDSVYAFARAAFQDFSGFPGYPYLADLATRAEYRAFADALSKELTREWITLTSSETAGDETKEKITQLTKKLEEIDLKGAISKAAVHDSYFGRGQIFLEFKNDERERELPLILDKRTIKKDSFVGLRNVEPMWTTPATYNSLDPTRPDFYKPTKWFVMGKQVHASRILTIITRELPDMLKPAFNFGGMSLSQLAEPYVQNWLKTRQSVADLITNFSTTALQTSMDEVLQGADDGKSLFDRIKLFTLTRSNRGMMVLDKDKEALVQLNVPLGGLHELQAQAQEQQCSVSKIPSVVLLGVAPSGFGNVAEGELSTWRDTVKSEQERNYRTPIKIVLDVLQLSMFEEIDPDISFAFNPLYQLTDKELGELRKNNADIATAYIDRGVIDPEEQREKLARDPESGYQGLDLSKEIVNPNMLNNDDQGEESNNETKDE